MRPSSLTAGMHYLTMNNENERPIAQIVARQSGNKMTDKMQLSTQKRMWNFYKHKLKDYQRDIEFWIHSIELHRNNAFENNKIGHEQLKKKSPSQP